MSEEPKTCPQCRGSKTVTHTAMMGARGRRQLVTEQCGMCLGAGAVVVIARCTLCNGEIYQTSHPDSHVPSDGGRAHRWCEQTAAAILADAAARRGPSN